MTAQFSGPMLTAVFVDYDNIYLSLKKKNEEAARRFAKDSALWLKEIEQGRLITPTNSCALSGARRIVMNRCYGNPAPRRNAADNSTDMSSFPFVRHHFLRAGFEVMDCPPLTAQLKNSADIRMVMEVRDLLDHPTRFEEFVLLSGDADFTPILHRLRAHARRTVVYANDHTAAPYTALSDGEVREQDLISFLLEGRLSGEADVAGASAAPSSSELEVMRRDIVAEVVATVRAAGQPLPLEALADRAVRVLGHDRTVATGWGGAGSFRDLLLKGLPVDVRLSDQAPFYVFDTSRQLASSTPRQDARLEPARQDKRAEMRYEPTREARFEQKTIGSPAAHGQSQVLAQPQQVMQPAQARMPMHADGASAYASQELPARHAAPQQVQPQQAAFAAQPPRQQTGGHPQSQQSAAMPGAQQPAQPAQSAQQARGSEPNAAIRQSIARIHEACQAPPLAPPEYRALFEVMAEEITANNLAGSQTLVNIMQRARELGVEIRRDDVRFVLEVVSEPDPWFEQGASANLFASRFRNFVVARCRGQGLNLSSDELDLIEAWFGGSPAAQRAAAPAHARVPASQPPAAANQAQSAQQAAAGAGDRWWSLDEGRNQAAESRTGAPSQDEEFPRIIRSRLRG